MYLYGVFWKSAKKIFAEIIELQHFLDNTNARQTGEKKNTHNLNPLLAFHENLTPPQLQVHANSMGRNPYVPCEYWTFIGQSKERDTDFNARETET